MLRRIFTFPVIAIMLVAGVFLALANPGVSPAVSAQDSQMVPPDWAHIPDGLEPGDSFRLLFVTSGARDATADNIADYNTFVQNAAAENDNFKDFSGQFRVLMNATDIKGMDNTGTTGTGVPIHWVEGAKVANDYDDFYDGSWASKAATDEKGNSLDSETTIWLAAYKDDTEAGYDTLAKPQAFTVSYASRTEKKHLYSLSPVLQVEVQESAAPEGDSSDEVESTNQAATGAPTISGTTEVGQTLTADTSGISDPDGLTGVTWSYQWLADDVEIAGATGETYEVRAEDVGKTIKVRVLFLDDMRNREQLTSAPTAAVSAQEPTPTPTPEPTPDPTPEPTPTPTPEPTPDPHAGTDAHAHAGTDASPHVDTRANPHANP